jgi:hypothetical protein
MGFHSFSLDPRTVLGVGPDASPEEIHAAYRAKSKQHHPDRGGDEWAFRMVARAYEVLRTTAAVGAAQPWEGRAAGPDVVARGRSADWSWTWGSRFVQPGAGAGMGAHRDADAVGATDARRSDHADSPGTDAAADPPGGAQRDRIDPARLRNVDVELIWTRFEKDAPARLLSNGHTDDATLSVCLVISWPDAELVDRTAEFPDGAEILRTLIDLFDRLRRQDGMVAARSRIEDGRFVGWLSYPDVLNAQDAVLALRETCHAHGLTIKLRTRDERIPFDWHAQAHAPLMSQAS